MQIIHISLGATLDFGALLPFSILAKSRFKLKFMFTSGLRIYCNLRKEVGNQLYKYARISRLSVIKLGITS